MFVGKLDVALKFTISPTINPCADVVVNFIPESLDAVTVIDL